ncbi:MAG: PqaA protein, partial [Planctomycetota bacterium]|nr:PqaA protein [Planctomycetota bacterium]
VRRWSAVNERARDFRRPVVGDIWQSEELAAGARRWIEPPLAAPPEGFRASFLELVWEQPSGPPLRATTSVRMRPDHLPHAGALGER